MPVVYTHILDGTVHFVISFALLHIGTDFCEPIAKTAKLKFTVLMAVSFLEESQKSGF